MKHLITIAVLVNATATCAVQPVTPQDGAWPLSYPVIAGEAVRREATVRYISDGFVNHRCEVIKSSTDLIADKQACKTVSYFKTDTPRTVVTAVWSKPKIEGVFVPPEQIKKFIIGPSDYPKDALAGDKQGSVVAKLRINETGKVENCEIAQSSGVTSLDRVTCSGFRTRARFSAATLNGTAVASAYYIQTSFTLGATASK